MEQTNEYSAKELKEKFPDGFEDAWRSYKEKCRGDTIPWQEEIMDSLKATFKAAGVSLTNWSIGAYDRSYVKFTIPTYWSELADNEELVDNLEGKKAYNWLKNSFDLKSYKRVSYKNHLGKPAHRYDFQKLDGTDWSCEFTGVCFDRDFLESLFECIHDKMNIDDAFCNLADEAALLLENEQEFALSEEYFLEQCDCNDWKFTEDGIRI